MVKRIGYSCIYVIIFTVVCCITNKLLGNPAWLPNSLIAGVGAFAGTFVGYGYGKADKDDKD